MKPTIPVAVVGAGRFGKRHVEQYLANARCELVALIDPDPATKELASRVGARWFQRAEDLPHGLVRAATVSVPDAQHAHVGMVLLRAGIDVLVEKPVATSLADADALIRAASDARRILQVGHVERFNPAVIAIPAPLAARRIDAVRHAPVPERGWKSDVILDLMIHDIELLVHWMGAVPIVVSARGDEGTSPAIDRAEATLAFAGGATATLNAARGPVCRRVSIETAGRHIELDCTARPLSGADAVVRGRDALGAQIEAFLDAVQHRTAPVVDGPAGRAALALALRIRDHVVAARSHPAA